jgi:hypothetical protein
MKPKFIFYLFLISILSVTVSSCSDDDSSSKCQATNISATINGTAFTFQAIGRGLDLRSGGYRLQLNAYSNGFDPVVRQFSITLPYKKTGKNVIQKFDYLQYDNTGSSIEGDFVTQQFTSNVKVNKPTCFYTTFSGAFTVNGQTINITNGKLSYEYEESFDE